MNTSVALAQAEEVGLSKAIMVGKSFNQQVGKDNSINVGKTFKLVVGSVVEIRCGKSVLRMDKSGQITLKGTSINLGAKGSIKIKGKIIDLN
ncbi:Uncharacterised protein [Pragia fontium]|uniref:hypothetical protein n=1 Tax=Pragia fontium TaxID=82985 RepID=UPI000E08084A|nr:hypothetical protein [Pragia fontium]SUB81855.1 Uncharacterised protein [Pragia fontium]